MGETSWDLISRFQNTQTQLERLAAQRHLYRCAKRIVAVQFVLSVPVVVTWSIAVLLNPGLRAWSAFWGLGVAVLDAFVLDSLHKQYSRSAAKIQELFDCDVLRLEWHSSKAGSKPDYEDIAVSAKKYRAKDPHYRQLKDWYPNIVDALPIHQARLICQRSNCRWDVRLRRRYLGLVVKTILTVIIVVLTGGLYAGLTLENFFVLVVAPLAPTLVWGAKEWKRHENALDALERVKQLVERVWSEAVSNTRTEAELQRLARDIQDEIFDRRVANPLIFDWLYNRLKDDQEEEMQVGADQLVRNALNRHSSQP